MTEYLAFFSSHPAAFMLFGVLASIVLYWVREKWRVVYASMEICAGGFVLWNAAPTVQGGSFSSAFDQLAFGGILSIQTVQIIGAIYFIIRGLDNLDKALKHSHRRNAIRLAVGLKP